MWFETHLDPNVGQQLEVILSAKEKWNKALQSFQKNWNFTIGRINVVRTNLIAEWSFLKMQNNQYIEYQFYFEEQSVTFLLDFL